MREWIHVEDHAHAVMSILTKGKIGETYLVGTNCERSNLEVLKLILKAWAKTKILLTGLRIVPDMIDGTP